MKLFKNIGLGFSVFFLAVALVAYGFGFGGKGFFCRFPPIGDSGIYIMGTCGGIEIWTVDLTKKPAWPHQFTFMPRSGVSSGRSFGERLFNPAAFSERLIIGLSFDHPDIIYPDAHVLVLPYWLLIFLFAIAPVWKARRHIVEKHKTKFFEQIQREKQNTNKRSETMHDS